MQILFVNCCFREMSRTKRLAEKVLEHLQGNIVTLDLNSEHIEPLGKESHAERDKATHSEDWEHPMLRYAHQFAAADEIVIAAPFWDLAFPALLKAYIEAVTVSGITFKYIDGIPHGLCNAKRLIYVTTAGGPVFADFGFSYIKTLAESFYGIPEVKCFRAENLDMIGANVEEILQQTEEDIGDYFCDKV